MATREALIRKYIDPDLINRIARLELMARRFIEGFLTGRQRSPFKGFSVEFASHREYAQGDDLRYLDWKVFARKDKLYIKEYEHETNINALIALDISKSMMYGSGDYTKFEHACFLAAALSYLMLKQHDSVGLLLFDREVRKFVPALTGRVRIYSLLETMEGAEIREKSYIAHSFSQVAGLLKRRKTLVLVVSDFIEQQEYIKKGLDYLYGNKNELVVMQVLDKEELDFSFSNLTQFEGLEEELKILCDPVSVRKEYMSCVNDFLAGIRKACSGLNAEYALFTNHHPLEVALTEFLIGRLEGRKRR